MLSRILFRNFSGKAPLNVAVTGAAGQIGYSLIFRIATGQMLGADQPINLKLIDLPNFQKNMGGVKMELIDSAFPVINSITTTSNIKQGFDKADYCLLVGAKPRGPGMERADLLKSNAAIFIDQGKTIDQVANQNCKILVVGNPANTNCLIGSHFAKRISKDNWTAMSRLDHDRGLGQLSLKSGKHISEIENFCVWGNHSPTMFPDITYCKIGGKKATELIDQQWYQKTFIPCVQKRGAEVIAARGLSSAASAANAAFNHMRSWHQGTKGQWVSACLNSKKEYGIPEGLIFSFPVTAQNGKWKIVQGLQVSSKQKDHMKATIDQLLSERKAVEDMLR